MDSDDGYPGLGHRQKMQLVTGLGLRHSNSRLGLPSCRRHRSAAAMRTTLLDGGRLVVSPGTTALLTGVPHNVTSMPHSGGAFLGAIAPESESRHIFQLGVLDGLRFMCCFRFKLWWMSQMMGTSGRDVPPETQFLLVETSSGSEVAYTVFLPLLDGPFRAMLQGNPNNMVELCIESGDPDVKTSQVSHAVYVYTSSDPYEAIGEVMRIVQSHLKTFSLRVDKQLPGILDCFGWCTWDAFYTDVSAADIFSGLKTLCSGGAPPRFLIIDDGWQSISMDQQPSETEVVITSGTQFASRLIDTKENRKFQDASYESFAGLQAVINQVKRSYNIKYVYMWHAMLGYWGGLKPGYYEARLTYPVTCPGVLANDPVFAHDSLTVNGLGLPHPKTAFKLYNDLHGYLASCGVDGVKVDVQNILESLGAGHGGRVELTKQYHEALEASIAMHFPDNGCISCMCHNTDGFYSSKQTAVARASDDFWPRDPASHTVHIASVAYNSLFLGEVMQPDWDMFQSAHPAAEFHAAARAIGGCSVYVSDKPGFHDFELLRRLVFPDGSILRAELPGRPTRDSLFVDPLRDGQSLLKIWNMNRHTGVLGAFNCQGAAWCKTNKSCKMHDGSSDKVLTGAVRTADIELLEKAAPDNWNGDAIVYSHRAGEIARLKKDDLVTITLKRLEYEVFTAVPLRSFGNGEVSFAAIGFIRMFNSGGCIKSQECFPQTVRLSIHGCGEFGAYSSKQPKHCLLDSVPTNMSYDPHTGLLKLMLEQQQQQQPWRPRTLEITLL